jgi:hypothetical protein
MIRYVAMAAERIVNLKKIERAKALHQEELPAIHSDEPLIAWSSRDHIPQEHGILWYAAILGLGALALFWALWTFNFIFALLVVAAVVGIFAASSRKPHVYNIKIFPAGIEIEGRPSLNFSEIESFWIFPATSPPLLFLRPRRHIKLPTYLLLENVDAEKVREVLLNYIPEREEEFPFSERISNWLGF